MTSVSGVDWPKVDATGAYQAHDRSPEKKVCSIFRLELFFLPEAVYLGGCVREGHASYIPVAC